MNFQEHIIFSCYEMRPRFHDMLAEEYVDRIKGLMKDYIHTLADGWLFMCSYQILNGRKLYYFKTL